MNSLGSRPSRGDPALRGIPELAGLWFVGPDQRPVPAPPEETIPLEEFNALLTEMQAASKPVIVGTMPGRNGETPEQRFGNAYTAIAIAFPIYFGTQVLDAGVGLAIGTTAGEFVVFQIAAKARGFIVSAGKRGGKLVLNVLGKEGETVTAAEFKTFVNEWNASQRAKAVAPHTRGGGFRAQGRPIYET